MNFEKIVISLSVLVITLLLPTLSLAHVVVKPAEVGVGQRLNFAVSVPTEEETPTVSVRLVIPEGVQSVRPNAKPGWNIQLKKSSEGEKAKITEIVWSGGSIPAEQRDEFIFSAQAPVSETSIVWKAYQTYGDGTVVAWENDPKMIEDYTKSNPPLEREDDHNAPRPYSQTQVVNDLIASPKPTAQDVIVDRSKTNNLPLVLSALAIVLSGFALGINLRKG